MSPSRTKGMYLSDTSKSHDDQHASHTQKSGKESVNSHYQHCRQGVVSLSVTRQKCSVKGQMRQAQVCAPISMTELVSHLQCCYVSTDKQPYKNQWIQTDDFCWQCYFAYT